MRGVGFGRPLWCATLVLAAVVTGCHHKSESVIPPVEPTATPSASANPSTTPSASPSPIGTIAPTDAQTSTTLNNAGGTVMLSSNGLSGTLTYPSNNSSVAVGAAFTMTTDQIPTNLPSPQPSGTPIVAFSVQFSGTTTFSGPLAVTPVTLPSSFSLNGAGVYSTLYDMTAGAQVGSTVNGTVSGQTATFPGPTTGTFGVTGGDVYTFVISYGSASSGPVNAMGRARKPTSH